MRKNQDACQDGVTMGRTLGDFNLGGNGLGALFKSFDFRASMGLLPAGPGAAGRAGAGGGEASRTPFPMAGGGGGGGGVWGRGGGRRLWRQRRGRGSGFGSGVGGSGGIFSALTARGTSAAGRSGGCRAADLPKRWPTFGGLLFSASALLPISISISPHPPPPVE